MKSLVFTTISLMTAMAFAETGTFEIQGMHCGGCQKIIESKVCKIEGVEKCTVELTDTKKQTGKVTLITKDGIKIDTKKIDAAVTSAGDYKITKSEVK